MPRASRTINKKQLTFNSQLSIVNCQLSAKGFTLIEFLVVMGILALVVGSITLFLTSVLKGANQSNTQAEVKQNGQAVLDSLERQIRGSTDAKAPDKDHLKIIREGLDPLYVACLTRSGLPIVKNDRIGTVVWPAVRDSDPLPSDYVSLSNDNPDSGVNITGCDFKVIPASYADGGNAPAVVSIGFDAKQPLNAPQRADFAAFAHFQTTISLRTYK